MKHPLFKSAHAMEDIARLKRKVENRVDANRIPVIDDKQLENPDHEELGCIYLTATPTDDGRDLVFIAERMIYSSAIDDNVPLGAESFRAASFSEWFAQKKREGWRWSE